MGALRIRGIFLIRKTMWKLQSICAFVAKNGTDFPVELAIAFAKAFPQTESPF